MPFRPPQPPPTNQAEWDRWARSVAVIPDNSSVGTAQLADGAVTTPKLADDAVTTIKIIDAAVTNAKLATMLQSTVKGRSAGAGTGSPEDLTPLQTKVVLSLSNVEDVALSTWAGSANLTTLGTVTTGIWNATVIADGKIASALTSKTYNALTLTAAAVGFTIAGGTTSKTLTVPLDATVSGTNTGDQTLPVGANPTGTVGLSVVNGAAASFLRSDAAPPLSQAILPTWTQQHIFSADGSSASSWAIRINATLPVLAWSETAAAADTKIWADYISSGTRTFGIFNDALSTTKNWLAVARSGNAVSSVSLGNATDNNTTTFLGTGQITLGGIAQLRNLAAASLPAAAAGNAGALAYVTDATATTRLSTVAGGGANKVIVYSDGANWLIL